MLNNALNRMLAIQCFPFSGMSLYKRDFILAYARAVKDGQEAPIHLQTLRDCVEKLLKSSYTIHTIDEVYLMLDKCYTHQLVISKMSDICDESVYMSVLSSLAKALISQRDGKLVYKYWVNEKDEEFLGGFGGHNKLLYFHALNRHMPLDLIIARYLLDNDQSPDKCDAAYNLNGNFGYISVGDAQLDDILEKGVADNHIHAGAYSSFSAFWQNLTALMTAEHSGNLKRIISRDERLGRHFPYILSAGILRVIMALYITCGDRKDFKAFLGMYKNFKFWALINDIKSGKALEEHFNNVKIASGSKQDLANEMFGYFTESWEEVCLVSEREGISLESGNPDPLSGVFALCRNIATYPESVLLLESMRLIESRSNDSFFAHLFFQYLRIRNYTFTLFVQQTTVKGLDYFQRFYHRSSNMRLKKGKAFWKNVLNEQFQSGYIHRLELRVTPDDNEAKLERNMFEFLNAYIEIIKTSFCEKIDGHYKIIRKIPRVGIVFHLIKSPDIHLPDKCWNAACEYGNSDCEEHRQLIYFGEIQEKYIKQVRAILLLRNKYPQMSRFIVGLDAASLENNTPVQVLAPIFLMARGSTYERLNVIHNYVPKKVQSMGFTFHAGEDFRHLLSGLRRMDEITHYAKFHAGDRIGHGTALGIDVNYWARENPIIVIPQLELLENYLWAWHLFSEHIHDAVNDLSYIENKVHKLAKAIYEHTEGLTTQVIIDAYRMSFNLWDIGKMQLYSINVPEIKCNNTLFCKRIQYSDAQSWNAEKLLLSRNCRHYQINMTKPVMVEISQEDVELCKAAQKILLNKFSKEGYFIEINPTSNITIGESDGLYNHHVFSINKVYNDEYNVMTCINTDDPSVFNTSITNELAYIYFGMLNSGMSREKSISWIERQRANGFRASFVRDDLSDEQFVAELEELLHNAD